MHGEPNPDNESNETATFEAQYVYSNVPYSSPLSGDFLFINVPLSGPTVRDCPLWTCNANQTSELFDAKAHPEVH
jgi:hypothetical protein